MAKDHNRKKTRILVTASTFPQCSNDASPRFVLDLTKAIQKSCNSECLILTPHSKGTALREDLEGVKVIRYRYSYPHALEKISGMGIMSKLKNNRLLYAIVPFFILSQLLATLKTIISYRPDIIMAHWIIPQGMVVYLVKMFFPNVKTIIISHGGDIALIKKSRVLKSLGRSILSKSNSIIAVSNFIKSGIDEISPTTQDQTEVIPMGVDETSFTHRMINHSENIQTDRKTIMFLGRLEKKKGVGYLLRAMPKILKRHPEARLNVIGEGIMKTELMQMSKRLGIETQVTFHGAIAHADLPDFFSLAEIFVVPSINLEDDTEGMPTVLAEAVAARVPVVATDAGGISDIIEDRVTGLLVEQKNPDALAEGILSLLDNPKFCNGLCEAAYKRLLENFTYTAIGHKYRDIIRTLVNRQHHSAATTPT